MMVFHVKLWLESWISSEIIGDEHVPPDEYDSYNNYKSLRDSLHDFYIDPDALRQTARSLLPKSKQRDQISQMLWNCCGSPSHGIYLHVGSKGIIKYSKQLSLFVVFSSKHYQELLITDRLRLENNFMSYIWTNKQRKMRMKHTICKEKSENKKKKKKKKKRKKKGNKTKKESTLIESDEATEMKSKEEPSIDKCKTVETDEKKIEENNSDAGDSDCGYDDGYDDEPQFTFRKTKKLSKKYNYLFSDAYNKPKHSKRQVQEMKFFLFDIVCCPSKKTLTNVYAEEISFHDTFEEDYSDHNLTFGNFFTGKNLGHLELNNSFDLCKNFESDCVNNVEVPAEDIIPRSEERIEKLENGQDDTSYVKSDFDCTNLLVKTKNENEHEESDNSNDRNPNVIVILSRPLLRPDNLSAEFRENYRESSCKKRRFILNISHLAYQHLISLKSVPFDTILKSDTNMYLIFAYLNEEHVDKDKYKVWISSTLPLVKPQEMFHELTLKKLTSIHELIHKAMDSLSDPHLNEILINGKKNQRRHWDKLPSCTFHLLQSVIKWKVQIMKPPLNSEWMDNQNSFSNFAALAGLNINSLCSNVNLTQANQSIPPSSNIRQGPSQSSLCGMCLQDFDEKGIFPIALVTCSHWFCEECWRSKLCSQIKTNQQESLVCIERGCTVTVNPMTLLTILDVELIRTFYKSKVIKMTHEPPNVISCPNDLCQKIIFTKRTNSNSHSIKSDQFIPITCSCFWQFCFKCFKAPHWPISCDISNTYNNCLNVQGHDTFSRCVTDRELPDVVLKGKSCPGCGIFIQEKSNQTKLEHCACGCLFCWPCGKQVDAKTKELHSLCLERFELSNQELKAKMMKRTPSDLSDSQISRWYKVALTHRQMRHPQVVRKLYEMADEIAVKISQGSDSGKYIGDVKQTAMGWKSSLRKWNQKMCERLKGSGRSMMHNANDNINNSGRNNDNDNNNFNENDTKYDSFKVDAAAVTSDNCKSNHQDVQDGCCSRVSSRSSHFSDSDSNSEFLGLQRTKSLSSSSSSIYDTTEKGIIHSLISKAASNIVQIKLEMHHIIEHTAALLEFDHSLTQSGNNGRIIRNLERAEDLCEGLGLLLQHPHSENTPRILPTFLRLRLQATNILMTLHNHIDSTPESA